MYLSFLFECQCVVTRQQLIKVDCDKSHQNMQLLTRHVKCRFSDDPKIIQEINSNKHNPKVLISVEQDGTRTLKKLTCTCNFSFVLTCTIYSIVVVRANT